MSEKAIYIPFNEAMCWGETNEKSSHLNLSKKSVFSQLYTRRV